MTQRRPAIRGFTMVELLMVLFIMLLLMGGMVPVFSKLVKTSRVDEAAKAVCTALWQSRSQAMRLRAPVALFYGDDPAQCNPAPQAGVLPVHGHMEMWTVRYWNYPWYQLANYVQPYYPSSPGNAPDWYPYYVTDRPLTPVAITIPDGVRIVTGSFDRTPSNLRLSFNAYRKDPMGEIKRHQTVFSMTGSLSGNSYQFVVVYDEASGDHRLIQAGFNGQGSYISPMILKDRIRYVNGTQVKSYLDLPGLIRNCPGDR